MVTSCIEDNGILTASVAGNTSEYIFEWYVGNAEKASPDFTGERYDSLAVGHYSVVAVSRETGCRSGLATAEITNNPRFPMFSVTSVASVCREDSYEPGTGFAALFMTNSVEPDSIIWSLDGGVVATGPIAINLDAGNYEVTVISSQGCETTQPFVVKTEIRPFNGVSRNNDGQNDIFHINCIENFPSNVVKIYNRAGTMVYEAQGYDNNGTFFDGQSNRGVSLMGTDLPGGTYFYIIDKRDGSKPLAGYLEIVN
jgi:gliding motility-associated-like protein